MTQHSLRPCHRCMRHIRAAETRCPFCDQAIENPSPRFARVTHLAFGAAVAVSLAGCREKAPPTTDASMGVQAPGEKLTHDVDSSPGDASVAANSGESPSDASATLASSTPHYDSPRMHHAPVPPYGSPPQGWPDPNPRTIKVTAGFVKQDVTVGKGRPVGPGDHVRVRYTGTLPDGTVFDASRPGELFEVDLGMDQVIPGFEAGVAGMRVGGKRKVTVPTEMAEVPPGFRRRGAIPHAPVVFEIELLGVSGK